jgi:hypothetical protein
MFYISDLSAASLLYREVKDEFALAHLTMLRPYLPLVCRGRVRARPNTALASFYRFIQIPSIIKAVRSETGEGLLMEKLGAKLF